MIKLCQYDTKFDQPLVSSNSSQSSISLFGYFPFTTEDETNSAKPGDMKLSLYSRNSLRELRQKN